MRFQTIAIVGLGLMGGSFAAAVKRKEVADNLIGVDYEEIVEKAIKKQLISRGFDLSEIQSAIADADLIFLAMPIKAIIEFLPRNFDIFKKGVFITDVGSTKVQIVNTARKFLPDGIHFLGGHPMTGSEKRGVDYADPFLFENATYVLTENKSVPNDLIESFVEILETIGAKVIFLPSELHDRIAAVVSHLPQMLAITLMNFAAKFNESNSSYLKLAAGGFRDMTRVASSPHEVWADILDSNRENINTTIEQFIEELNEVKKILSVSSQAASLFEMAAQNRLSIPKDTRGFLNPHFDISIIVEDKPGVIASISTLLANEKINIKDIEVLKVREGDAGTLRLAFESQRCRDRAIALLINNGYQATKRE